MNVLDKLYLYQKDAVTSTFYKPKGIVCLPTGLGKTFIQSAVIANDIQLNSNQFRMYVVNAPRIMLTYQLLKEVYGFLTSLGIEARYMFVHSGGKSNESELEEMRMKAIYEGHNIPFSEISSGTSVEGIVDMMRKAKEQELPLIMFSTYNSASNIEEARKEFKRPISIVLSDEAHYLVQEQFHDILSTLTSSRSYFFTATTVHTSCDKGRGMNNSDVYGDVLYKMIPREAIEMGKMVRPRMHFINTQGVYKTDDYKASLSRIIYESFYQHDKCLTKLKPKVLISVKGSQDIIRFFKSPEYKKLREDNVSIYAVATHELIGNDINGEKVNRQTFLSKLKNEALDKENRILILHYDVLSEGIDVPGITGIMPLRTLNKSKFLQTFGRAARLDVDDRRAIEQGTLKVHDLDNFNKPFAYIIVPNVVHSNQDDKENFIHLITELRDYGFNPSEDIITSSYVNGIAEIEELSGLNNVVKRLPNVGELIENLEAELENEKNAKLSKTEFIDKIFL